MTVTQDAASSKYVPVNTTEMTSFLAGTGVAAPVGGWLMQDAAAPIADFIGSDPMTDLFSNEAYQQSVPGWTRKGIVSTPQGGSHALLTTHLVTTSGTALILRRNNTAPTANRVIGYLLGAAVCVDSSGHIGLSDGGTTTFVFGSAAMGTTVHPVVIRVNSVGPTSKVTTDQESVTGPAFTFDTASDFIIGNPGFGIGGPDESYLFALRWSSVLSDPDVTAVISRFTTGAVASIAVTPSSPSLLVAGTQQMTAIATFQDGSTLDVTSNALTVWTSSTPATGTINATGLFTGVAPGTSGVTAAFGGVTSSSDTVTVVPSAVPSTITLAPNVFALQPTQTQQITATAVFSGVPSDYTAIAAWTTSNAGVATVVGGLVTAVAPGTVTITAAYPAGSGVPHASAIVYVHLDFTLDQNEHHPWPGVTRGIWDHDGEQVVWTGDRVLVARDGDYSLGSSSFWNRNTAGDLLKRGLPAYLPLQTDVIPAVTAYGSNSYVETCLTPTLRAVIVASASGAKIDIFDRQTSALVRHREFAGVIQNPRIMMSGDHLIATWMANSPGALMMTTWTGDDWTTPQILSSAVQSYECAVVADGVHFCYCETQAIGGGIFNLRMGRLVGVSPASTPYAWGTIVGGAASNFSSVAVAVAPDNTVGIAFIGDLFHLSVFVFSADLTVPIFANNMDNSPDNFGGLSICSRGLKNVNGEYEWLVHYRTPSGISGAATIKSFFPLAGTTSVVEQRFNTYFISKSFRVGDEVFIWATEVNSNTAFLLGGHYQAQTCAFADREVAQNAPEDGTTTFLHQVLPDPLSSGDRTGPFTIIKKGGVGGGVWDAEATSSATIPGDGYVAFHPGDTTTRWSVGLSNGDTNTSWDTIRYSLLFDGFDGTKFRCRCIENGTSVFTFPTSYATTDTFSISRTAGVVSYVKNGVVGFTSAGTNTAPLIFDSAFDDVGSKATSVLLVSAGVPIVPLFNAANTVVYSETSGYGPTQTGTAFTWARQFNTGQDYVHPGNVRIGDIEFLPELSTAAYGACTYVSGSAVRCWDGAVLGDAGFQSYPIVKSLTASSGGSLTAGDKRYRCYIVRYNQAGERFECGAVTSPPITVTASQKVAVVIQTVPDTNHSDAIIEVYTTQAGGTTFYLEGEVANDMTVPTVTFNSTISDAQLGTRDGDTHATGVGQPAIVETFGPLGSSVLATSGDRLWGAGGQVPRGIVQFSTLHTDGSAAGFDDLSGTQEVDTEGGAITSISRSGDATVVWEASKLFVISGVGPDNYGSGSFSIPEIVLTDGAITHQGTALTPNGAVYWGDGGPRALSNGYQGVNIALPVQLLTKTMTPTGVRVDTTAQEVTWYTSTGDALLWNYMGGNSRFARWSGLNVAAASPTALAMTNGQLFYPRTTSQGDAGRDFQFKLRTGLIRADQVIGGGTRIRSTGVTGEFKGPHEIRARFYFDGAPCWTEEWDWAPQDGSYLQLVTDVGALLPSGVDALGLVNKAGTYITHTRTRQNDCAYMQIEVDNKGAHNPTFVPTEITLEIGVSPTLARISPHPVP